MNLRNAPITNKPPTPEERRTNIESIRWWLFDKFDYEPNSAQSDVHHSKARFRIPIAGTRGGKSRLAGEEAVVYLFAGATRVWIVGQNYGLTEKEFRYVDERMTSQEVYDIMGGSSPIEKRVYNESQGNMEIRTKWGSWIKCVSLERYGGALGEEVDLIIMSEAAQIRRPKIIYERELRGRLASRIGDVIIPTTPAGRTNRWDSDGWLFSMYAKGLDPEEPNYYTREWPSWENPYFKEDVDELRRELDPKVFAEQYEGKFMVFSGAVYGEFDKRVHVVQPFVPPKHWYRYEAIDPGFSGRFVWLSCAMSEAGNLYIMDEYSDQQTRYEERAQAIMDRRCEQYNIPHGMWDTFQQKHNIRTLLYIDPEDPQCREELRALGLPGLGANNNIPVGVDRVARRLRSGPGYRPRLYVTANCTETIEAFEFHSWGDRGGLSASGEVDMRKPANDKWKHWMDCVRYVCAGNLVTSPPPPEKPAEQETMWEIMQEHIGMYRERETPFGLSAYERRTGGFPRPGI